MKSIIFQLECGRQGGSVEGSCAQVMMRMEDVYDDENYDEDDDENE